MIRNTNRLLSVLGVAAVSALLAASPAQAKELRIMSWQGYADDDWVQEFEEKTGADVEVVFIASDDEIWAKMMGSEGKDFDIFAVNSAQLQRYIDAGLTTPIDLAAIPNQQTTLPRFNDLTKVQGITRDGNVHAIPFAFDASGGLIYDKDKVQPTPTSMSILWDPKYQGKVLAYDNGEYNFSFTALVMGFPDPFNLSPEQYEQIKAKLIALKSNVLTFYTNMDDGTQIYQNNDVALIWANFGRLQVKAMEAAGANIGYIIPERGRARLARHLGAHQRRQGEGAGRAVDQLPSREEDQRRDVGAHRVRQHGDRDRRRQSRRQADLCRACRESHPALGSVERNQGSALICKAD